MYERMLDKANQPTIEEFFDYCGESKPLLENVDAFLRDAEIDRLLRFPYGKSYGWGMKYFKKSLHICDIFAENGSFTVMLRLPNALLDAARDSVAESTRESIDNRYPCGEGGWVRCRVCSPAQLEDAKKLLVLKLK